MGVSLFSMIVEMHTNREADMLLSLLTHHCFLARREQNQVVTKRSTSGGQHPA